MFLTALYILFGLGLTIAYFMTDKHGFGSRLFSSIFVFIFWPLFLGLIIGLNLLPTKTA